MIELQNINAMYGSFMALREINLKLDPGEITGLIGANGAGKSTLLRLCAGLHPDFSGHYFQDGIEQKILTFDRSATGFAAEDAELLPYLTGYEYLKLIASLNRITAPDQEIDNLLQITQLTAEQHHLINSYSHGMRQKIQLGAALLTAKKILLIDEAMNGLDSLSLHYLKKHLREKREQGLSIVLASHFIPLVTEISDRILLLNKGRLLYEFSAADVKNIEAQTGFEKYVISLIETDQSAD